MKNRPKERGLLLVTTLLIVAFLTALTVGFIVINRDNLMFARRIREGENALQAAYAGLHYVMMRLEEDRGFGVAPYTPGETRPNTSTRQYDPFPDGMPTEYGQPGRYWNGNGSGGGYTIPYNSSSFTVYETGATVVGLISGNDSHFQIHFRHFGGGVCPTFNGPATTYASNGFDDLSVASEDYRNWKHQRSAQEMHSLNNLNNPVSVTSGRKMVPAYTARIIATGYSHGSTRVVEALLKRVFFTNSSALAASDITVRMSTLSTSGDGTWYISSLAPSSNSIEAGAGYDGGRFRQAGGDINAYTGLSSSIPADRIIFSTTDTNTRNTGNGYALRTPGSRPPPGTVRNIGGSSYPNASGQTFVNAGKNSGTFYAAADNTVPLPPRDLTGSDVLSQMGATPIFDSSGVRYISRDNNCFIEPGIWAFESNEGKGDRIQVYNFSGGSGSSYTGNIGPCLAVNNYQLMIRPGKHVVVGSAGTAQGDLMITLSPADFNSSNNRDIHTGKNVLPTLALGYQGANQLGDPGNRDPKQAPATLTLGGNLYVQGQVVGRGAIIAQSNTTTNGNWLPANFTGSWASAVYNQATEGHPLNLDSADIFIEGTSQLQKSPNYSVVLYSEGNTRFNPLVSNLTDFTDQLGVPTSPPRIPPDSQAFANGLNHLACRSSGCSGEWWTQAIPQPTNNPIGASLNSFIEFGHDLTKLTPFLRTIKNRSGPQGANSAPTDKTAGNIWCPENPSCRITDDQPAVEYLRRVDGSSCDSNSCDGSRGVLNLYQYAQFSNYQATRDNQWLVAYPRPSPDSLDPLNPVEYSIVSSINQYAQQAYMGNHQNLGAYLGRGTTLDYQQQDLTFQGFIYSKGPNGFVSYPNNTRFAFQGAVVTTRGPMEIGNGPFDPGQANFLYDPSHLLNFYRLPYGNPITIQWMVVW